MSLGSPVKTPRISPLPGEPKVAANAEAEAARRDLEERMKRATMNREKSKLTIPALVKPVESIRPALKMKLG